MWDNTFTMDVLTDNSRVAVNCPDEELERELAALLDERGIEYNGGGSPIGVTRVWGKYGEDFCYYISGKTVWRGPKSSTTESPWRSFEKYTFHGEPQDGTEIDDDSFCSIIGR